MQDTLPIHFAPLQGYTEAFYRNAHAKYFGGVDTYYTPFVRLESGLGDVYKRQIILRSYDWKEEIPVAEMSGESNLRRIRSPT